MRPGFHSESDSSLLLLQQRFLVLAHGFCSSCVNFLIQAGRSHARTHPYVCVPDCVGVLMSKEKGENGKGEGQEVTEIPHTHVAVSLKQADEVRSISRLAVIAEAALVDN